MPGGPRGLQNRRRFVLRVEVGSIPTLSASFIEEIERLSESCTEFAQNSIRPPDKRVRFPASIGHRTTEAKIYAPAKNFAYYRLSYTVAGKRFSLLAAVSEFSEVIALLKGRPLRESVEGFLTTIVSVKRKSLAEAVTEFTASREPKTKPKRTGERAALNAKYVENTRNWLKAFAEMFPGYCVCDPTKEHLDAYVATLAELSAKSRNHRRAITKQFLRGCVAKDYVSQSHRLLNYGREGRTIIILLGGGSKRRQDADITAAVERWKRYKQAKI